MVNEIDGYKAPTESQSSRPLPACWMVKEIARYGAGKCSLASNLIHHRASSMGLGDPWPFESERKRNRDEPKLASMATLHQPRLFPVKHG